MMVSEKENVCLSRDGNSARPRHATTPSDSTESEMSEMSASISRWRRMADRLARLGRRRVSAARAELAKRSSFARVMCAVAS